ncbi:Uridine kinase [Microbotryomycetes sp. JL221]|nr:Uridine kinase [Microbotryomycetes sp. JL221]
MAKKPAKTTDASGTLQATNSNSSDSKKRASAFEIDDIFAKKVKPTSAEPSPETPTVAASAATASKKKKKSKKDTKEMSVASSAEKANTITSQKVQSSNLISSTVSNQRVPETVVDSSASLGLYPSAPTPAATASVAGQPGAGPSTLTDEDRRFMDSRGTMRRKTDDGLPIYDIAELKIGLGGGKSCPTSLRNTAPSDRCRVQERTSPLGSTGPNQGARKLPKNVILTEAGRSAWYGKDGQPRPAYLIGIAGGSASGKTRVATEIIKSLNVPWVTVISQDNFYKSLTPAEMDAAFRNEHDFDNPQSFDYELLRQMLSDLKACRSVQVGYYYHTSYLYGAAVVIIEGLFVLHDKAIRDELDLKVFVQCDSDLMLARRLRRDIVERGRTAEGVLDQYLRFVKPSFDNFLQPTSRYADILVPGERNDRSIDLITGHIRRQLEERRIDLRTQLYQDVDTDTKSGLGLPPTVYILEQGPQLRGCMTILRSRDTPLVDFVFSADRISRRVVSHALTLLPYREAPIRTGTGIDTVGKEMDIEPGHLCGVSILRSGASLEKGLRRVVRDVPLGSMLIQSDAESGEPFLYQLNLPQVVTASTESASRTYVLLLDSTIGTGAAALMAVRVLLDHGVPQDHIIMCTILVSKVGGVWPLHAAFPRVRVVSSAADDGLEERWEESADGRRKKVFAIQPGLGSFGSRYFGAGN